jgi:hypothetical protein
MRSAPKLPSWELQILLPDFLPGLFARKIISSSFYNKANMTAKLANLNVSGREWIVLDVTKKGNITGFRIVSMLLS